MDATTVNERTALTPGQMNEKIGPTRTGGQEFDFDISNFPTQSALRKGFDSALLQ